MSPAAKRVPRWVRIVAGLVALLNLAYGPAGYFAPASVLPGLGADTSAALNAIHMFSARNTAIGIALAIVSLVGVPESIAIVMIIRFLVEAQDLALSIIGGKGFVELLTLVAFIIVELTVIVTMFRIVGQRDKDIGGR